MSALALPLVRRARLPLVCGAAGFLAGLLALGGGLRLAMRAVALLNRDELGLFTENGNLVGEVTLEGTLFLLAAGAVVGLAFGLAYGVVRSWLPGRGAVRGTVFGVLLALALGTPTLVDPESVDFGFLAGDGVAIALLLACPVAYGALLGTLVDRLAPSEPRVLRRPAVRVPGTLVVAAAALAGTVRLVGAVADIAAR